MSRRARIVCQVADAWGDLWDVRRIAQAGPPHPHTLICHQGWPHGQKRGRGGAGGPSWILTLRLIAWLESVRYDAFAGVVGMPFGRDALKRMRRQLGHHGKMDRRNWWIERLDDLASLTSPEFVARHPRVGEAMSEAAVDLARMDLLGPRGQHKAGWRADAETLLSGLPTQVIADRLGIPVDSACKLRWLLEEERGLPHHREIGRRDSPEQK